jgi:peptide deformylase
VTVLEIATVGDPVLRERAPEVGPDELPSAEVQQLIDDFTGDGVLFLDRVIDPRSLSTWEQFERHRRDEFLERIRPYT